METLTSLVILFIFSIIAAILGWTERDKKWLRLVLKIGVIVTILFAIMLLDMLHVFLPYESYERLSEGQKFVYMLLFNVLPLILIFILSSRLMLKYQREIRSEQDKGTTKQ